MRQHKAIAACVAAVLSLALVAYVAVADGILLPDDPALGAFDIAFHDVTVTIRDGIVTTHVDELFRNPSHMESEARYLFPLPPGAVVSAFTLWIDGEPVEAQLLGADEARAIYTDYVRRAVDPALLEYVGRDTLMARIFPVPAGGERRIEIVYTEILAQEQGMYRYRYPLDTERFSASPIDRVSLSIELATTIPLAVVYSPSHALEITRHPDGTASATYDARNALPRDDFILYYAVTPDLVGSSLLTYRAPGEDGFFLYLATPPEVGATSALPKDIILVLDRSGSMSGSKIVQARDAMTFILESLNPDDRFAIVAFSSSVEASVSALTAADGSSIRAAQSWVARQSASGGTDIDSALRTGLALFEENDRPRFLIFLTDGQPTVGVVEPAQIVAHANAANTSGARVFVFGVGYDVNTVLLDQLAAENRGTTSYVLPEDNLELALSSFYRKIASPVLADPVLSVEGVSTFDVLPVVLPDVFRGTQLLILGRYRGSGEARVTLSGTQTGTQVTFSTSHAFPSSSLVEPAVARLWAGRKIASLLDQIRLYGEDVELVDEVIALSRRYGIITPYTSFLAEETALTAQEAADAVLRSAAPTSGATAVQATAMLKDLAQSEAAPAVVEAVRIVGDRTYFLREEEWVDSEWTDTAETIAIAAYSDAYFELLTIAPWIGPHLALADRSVVRVDAVYVRIGLEGARDLTEELERLLTP